MQRVCVFCGSSPGNGTNYLEAARELGSLLARRQLTLVYGGGNVGLMGQAARSCLEGGGDVIGVITRQLVKMEVALTSLENLEVVETMHERKARMAELADGFIAMPGGLGTIEEIFEVITWSQLGIHRKPCAFLNTNGYYDGLFNFLDHAVDERFIGEMPRKMILVDREPESLLDKMAAYQPPHVDKGAWAKKLMEETHLK
ncbi:cytokinin riboside 5'-monophosphate phosphoribohydrolase [Leptolinea sp. HRD-7]|nr:cytokinin riboside 5'-monophosphate phosphoribohydrolase [Leptolinea sp. HRD-7]